MVVDSLARGGKERRLIELMKGLRSREVQCELVVLSDAIEYDEVYDLGIQIHIIKRKIRKDPTVFLKLFKICKDLKPTVIQTWESMPSIYAIPITLFLGIPLVNAMIAEAPAQIKRFDKRWTRSKLSFPFSTVVVANSKAGLEAYSAPKRKSRFIHNGFDFRRLGSLTPAQSVREKFNLTSKSIVGMVASFSPLKDYRTFILAATRILNKRDDVCFVCIGGGQFLPEHQKLVEEGLRSKILFLGSQKGVESIVNTFTVGVLSTYTEGISNAIMEYMALGKPVVATDGGGTNELLVEGKTGFLVTQKSVDEMAQQIERLLDDEDLAQTMGAAGKQRIKDHFNLDRMTEEFISLYQELMVPKNS